MTVTDAYLGGTQYNSVPPMTSPMSSPDSRRELCVNSDANLAHNENGTVDHIGSKTECALLQMVEDLRGPRARCNLPESSNLRMLC